MRRRKLRAIVAREIYCVEEAKREQKHIMEMERRLCLGWQTKALLSQIVMLGFWTDSCVRVAEAVKRWDDLTNDAVVAYAYSHKRGAVDSGPS